MCIRDRGDVVVLDENAVGKIEAVIFAAATADGVLVENAQAGDGFARVEDFGARVLDSLDIFAGEGGYAAHTLHQVEDDALACQYDTSIVTNYGDGLALAEADSVEDLGMANNFVASARFAVEAGEDVEETRDAADAGEDALLLSEDGRSSAKAGLDGERRGDVAGGLVFDEGLFEDGFNAACLLYTSRCV